MLRNCNFIFEELWVKDRDFVLTSGRKLDELRLNNGNFEVVLVLETSLRYVSDLVEDNINQDVVLVDLNHFPFLDFGVSLQQVLVNRFLIEQLFLVVWVLFHFHLKSNLC